METVKGVAIIAYKGERNPRFIVLKRTKNWEGWETPKGHLEEDDYRETVKIELEEEAGIERDEIDRIREMDETLEWEQEEEDEEIRRVYRAFLVKVDDDSKVDVTGNPDEEHESGYFFRYSDAESLLTYEDNVELLEKAKGMIEG